MVCPSCGQETNGVKMNGKLFCNFCGELIKDTATILEDSYQQKEPLDTKAIEITSDSEPKIITPDNREIKIKDKPETKDSPKMPEAKLAVTNASPKEKDKTAGKKIASAIIHKHHRPRSDNNHYKLVPGEPDPIHEPELETPHDDLLESEPKTKAEAHQGGGKPVFNLMPKGEREALEKSKKKKQDAFASFLKETSGAIAPKSAPSKKVRKKTQRRSIAVWLIAIIAFLALGLGGLVYYVNIVVKDKSRIVQRLEDNAGFSYVRPVGLPVGYELSYLSEKGDGYILYYYTFSGDKNRNLTVKIQNTELDSAKIWDNYIKNSAAGYTSTQKGGLTFWQTTDHKIFVINEGVLYTFANSGEIYDEQFMSFAEGMLL